MYGITKLVIIAVICVVVCACVYLLYVFFRHGKAESIIYSIRQYQWNRYIKRKNAHTYQEENVGVVKEKGLLSKLDRILDEAGWRKIYSYLSSEIFLMAGLLISCLAACTVYLFLKRIFLCFIIAVAIWLILGIALYVCAAIRYKKIENQLMVFINLLENFSRTSDDLVDIISKTENYLEEPLKNTIARFQWEARHTGEIETALGHLKTQLPHRKLQEIIQNLDMCRRHDANYEEVINDMRVTIQEYLKSKEERKGIQQAAKGNILVMMMVGIFILKLVNGFVEGGIYKLLMGNVLGMIIMVYIITLAVFGIWQFIRIDRN